MNILKTILSVILFGLIVGCSSPINSSTSNGNDKITNLVIDSGSYKYGVNSTTGNLHVGPNVTVKIDYVFQCDSIMSLEGPIDIVNPDPTGDPIIVVFAASNTNPYGKQGQITLKNKFNIGENTIVLFRSQLDILIDKESSEFQNNGTWEFYTEKTGQDLIVTSPSHNESINIIGQSNPEYNVRWLNKVFLDDKITAKNLTIECLTSEGELIGEEVFNFPAKIEDNIDSDMRNALWSMFVSKDFGNYKLPSGKFKLKIYTNKFAAKGRSLNYLDKIFLGESEEFNVISDILIDELQPTFPNSDSIELNYSGVLEESDGELIVDYTNQNFIATVNGNTNDAFIYYTLDGSGIRYTADSSTNSPRLSSGSSIDISGYNPSNIVFNAKVKVKGYKILGNVFSKRVKIKLPIPVITPVNGKVPFDALSGRVNILNKHYDDGVKLEYSINNANFSTTVDRDILLNITPGDRKLVKAKLTKESYQSSDEVVVECMMQLPKPLIETQFDSTNRKYIIRVKKPSISYPVSFNNEEVKLIYKIDGKSYSKNINLYSDNNWVIKEVTNDSNINIEAYFSKVNYYKSITSEISKFFQIPFVISPPSNLNANNIRANVGLNDTWGHWIPNDGSACKPFYIYMNDSGNVLQDRTLFVLKGFKDPNYNSGWNYSQYGNIFNNNDSEFELYATNYETPHYTDKLIATFKNNKNGYYSIEYKSNILGESGLGVDSDGDGMKETGLCFDKGLSRIILKYQGNKYTKFFIKVKESKSYPGDDILLRGSLFSNDTNYGFTAFESDFLAVYDKKLLWRANLYIKESSNDWNDKNRWESDSNEWNKEYSNKNISDIETDYMKLNNMYSSSGGQTIDIFPHTPLRTVAGTIVEPNYPDNVVENSVPYDYPNNYDPEFKTYLSIDSPFDYNYKMIKQRDLIREQGKGTATPSWNYTTAHLSQWKKYESVPLGGVTPYIPSLGLSNQNYFSHVWDEKDSQGHHDTVAKHAGTDCIGFAQRTASYQDNNYKWVDLTKGITEGGDDTTDAPRSFPYIGLYSNKISSKSSVSRDKVSYHLDKIVPGDIFYWSVNTFGISNGRHIAVVQDIIYSSGTNSKATTISKIKLIESTFSGISAKVINTNKLDFYNNKNWFIVRLKTEN